METKAKIIRPDNEEEKKDFIQKLSDFVSKKRVIFLSIAGALAGILLIVGVYSIVSNSHAENSSRAMEEVRTKIAAWNDESEEAKKTELESGIMADIDDVAKKWPKSFAAQQALFTKSSLYAVKKDWANAETASLEASKILPKTYLAPLALESAAVAAEEQGKADVALEYYSKIIAQYKEDTPNLSHAYFSVARLNEAKSDWKAALESYNKILSDFPDTDWAKLAKDRVVYLKAQGYDK
ncbi:MAG TPA: tetratricopeptide repeat protein [Rectinemataceae bacterium]|nr:tetratricopeptide repeat protein [Rectinemataceae bacterium]